MLAEVVTARSRRGVEWSEETTPHGSIVRLHFPPRPETPAMTSTGETYPADLVRRIRNGDPRAEEELIARFGEGLTFLLRRWTRGHSDAEDQLLLRRIIREEAGLTSVTPSQKWRGGTLVLRPGTPGLQEKTWPIETFFHKVVMLRNRLRTLEQQVNASELPEDVKVKLQSYVSGCYGSLTSFNVLFADESDQFKGSGGD